MCCVATIMTIVKPGTHSDTESDRLADEFGNQMFAILNNASLGILISIGQQTGLFDTLAGLQASTSLQIAAAASLDERYVREWLGGMVTGGIIDYQPEQRTYVLPNFRAARLTKSAGPRNIGRKAMHLTLFAEVEQKIIECFRNGGGLPYSEFPRFNAVMAEDSAQAFDHTLIDSTLPLVTGLPEWLRAGIDVADFGCGSGHAINLMAQEYPASRFTGYDFSATALDTARTESDQLGLENASFISEDLAKVEAPDAYDAVMAIDAIHDQVDPARVLVNIYRALRPGGVFLMVDIKASSNLEDNISIPWASMYYTTSTMHCMTVSLSAGGAGLGTMWGTQLATEMLAAAGFADITVHNLESDPFKNYYVAHK